MVSLEAGSPLPRPMDRRQVGVHYTAGGGLPGRSPHPSAACRRTVHLERIVPMYNGQPISREDIGPLLVQPVSAA